MSVEQLYQDLKTPLDNFYHWEKESPDRIFLRQPFGKTWHELNYAEAGQIARKMTTVLQELGLQSGDHIGILSKNCYHWILADLSIMMGGFVSVPFFASLPKKQLGDVIKRSDIKLLFAGKLDQWGDRSEAIGNDLKVIRFPHYEGNAKIEVNHALDWDELVANHQPISTPHQPILDELWTILFTSGTTGSPKGVMHAYRAPALIIRGEQLSNFIGVFKHGPQQFFSFLPLNHVAERIAVEAFCLACGGTISFAQSIDTFARNLKDVQPTFIFAVPRIWMKFYIQVTIRIPRKWFDVLTGIPILGNLLKGLIRRAMGLGRTAFAATGAAITPAELKLWYSKLGIHLIEAYGMTEVCGSIANSPCHQTPPDSVGEVVPYCEVKIDPTSGEVLLKSPQVMLGYYKEPAKTAEVLRNGWIHSGDRGRMDEKGFLYITGRIKDAFKTAKGKYIVPNPIEEQLLEHDYIEQACLVGYNLAQPIALINLSDIGKACPRDEVVVKLELERQQINKRLATYELVSHIIIQEEIWTEENQLLTPTLKVRRGMIDQFFANHYLQWAQSESPVLWT